ncbi:hypothetical protein KCG44_01440 [Pacificimonas sp. WHA3]|uniref:Uncharacterized protein n=1 Tax=Pacificimonas pallii TaxID=2827236 RepID=A0ABS6SAW2_9SPHN|nr:hypothetical protein [Pacificimonas pallii]MBV7255441.1 hypothetical protein [Pacificimonas pallii]
MMMKSIAAGALLSCAAPAMAQIIDPELSNTYEAPSEGSRWAEPDAVEAGVDAAIYGAAHVVAEALGIDDNTLARKRATKEVRRAQVSQDLIPSFSWEVDSDEIGPPDPEKLSLARACAEDVVNYDVLDARIVSVSAVEPQGILHRVTGRALAPFGETDFQCDVKPSGRITRFALAPR